MNFTEISNSFMKRVALVTFMKILAIVSTQIKNRISNPSYLIARFEIELARRILMRRIIGILLLIFLLLLLPACGDSGNSEASDETQPKQNIAQDEQTSEEQTEQTGNTGYPEFDFENRTVTLNSG